MKLSYSKVEKYKQCPAMYDFHYNKKLRTKYIGSPLFFGTAIDDAIGILKLPLKKSLTDKEKEKLQETPETVFKNKLTFMNHNGEEINIRNYPYINYSKSDIEAELLDDEDLTFLKNKHFDDELTREQLQVFAENIADKKRNEKILEKEEFLVYNDICWLSLYRKGLMLIDAYRKEIIPQIKEIVSIQEIVTITNNNGDEVTGFIDDVRIYKDEPNVVYINDDKTSSKPYKQEQVDSSPQLTTYAWYKDIDNICYTVMEKNIRKKEPRVRITILKGIANEDYKNEVLESYENVLHLINSEEFSPNFDSGCRFYGAKCLYHDICHKDEMPDYIIDLKGKNE